MAGRLHTGNCLDKAHHCHNYRTDTALLSTSEILVLFNLPAWASLLFFFRKFLTVVVISFSLHTQVDLVLVKLIHLGLAAWLKLWDPGMSFHRLEPVTFLIS